MVTQELTERLALAVQPLQSSITATACSAAPTVLLLKGTFLLQSDHPAVRAGPGFEPTRTSTPGHLSGPCMAPTGKGMAQDTTVLTVCVTVFDAMLLRQPWLSFTRTDTTCGLQSRFLT